MRAVWSCLTVVVGTAACGPMASEAPPPPDSAVDAPSTLPADAALADAGQPAEAALRCNGHAALCDRRFDQVVFPATHNAMSNSVDGWFGANQEFGMARQLADGVRAMLIDTHAWRGGSYLCHSVCALGSKPLVDGLGEIATFLRDNPHEVVTLIIEDGISAAETEKAFAAGGLVDSCYVHAGGAAWPTLRAMIASGKRLVVTAENGRPPPAWYHHVWDLAWDTPYTFRNKDEFSCRGNRGSRANALFLLNHWIENPLPSTSASAVANARDVLLARARQCQTESGKLPNFVAVNHYATGDLFAVVRELNGL